MRIGLLTVHCSTNAGASLQAYALCETLKKIGYEVDIINYRPSYFTDSMDELKREEKKPLKVRIAQFLMRKRLLKEHNSYVAFEQDFLPRKTKRFNTYEELLASKLQYDIFMCGSDQIWNPKHVRYDEAMFLGFVSGGNAKKVSYAASIGQDRLEKEEEGFLKKCVQNMDYISVREESAKAFLEQLEVSKMISRNIDPTLLLTKEEWRSIESEAYKKVSKDYILFYPLVDNPITDELIKRIKEKYHLPVVALSRKVRKIPGVDIQIRNFSPQDFVGYIDHAQYVITNSFHGNVFSMIFEQKLIAYENPIRNTRLTCLYDLFKTETIQMKSVADFAVHSMKEWPSARLNNEILQKERQKSYRYLSQFNDKK